MVHKAGGGMGLVTALYVVPPSAKQHFPSQQLTLFFFFSLSLDSCAFYTGISGILTPETSYFTLPTGDLSRGFPGKAKSQ